MKLYITVILGMTLAGCASQQKVPTFDEAVKNGDIESGWYTKKNRENVYVDVQAPRQKQEEAEKKAFEAQREADYQQRKAEALQNENMLLRARGNYKLEKQVNEVQGFDNQNNPIVKQKTVNEDPPQYPERYENHGGIKGYKASPEPREVVEYKDPYRITNEGSVPPGTGTKPLYPSMPKVEAPQAAPVAEAPKPVAPAPLTPPVEAARAPASEAAKAAVPAAASSAIPSGSAPAAAKPGLVSELPAPITE
jgi:hypothetical protein